MKMAGIDGDKNDEKRHLIYNLANTWQTSEKNYESVNKYTSKKEIKYL